MITCKNGPVQWGFTPTGRYQRCDFQRTWNQLYQRVYPIPSYPSKSLQNPFKSLRNPIKSLEKTLKITQTSHYITIESREKCHLQLPGPGPLFRPSRSKSQRMKRCSAAEEAATMCCQSTSRAPPQSTPGDSTTPGGFVHPIPAPKK